MYLYITRLMSQSQNLWLTNLSAALNWVQKNLYILCSPYNIKTKKKRKNQYARYSFLPVFCEILKFYYMKIICNSFLIPLYKNVRDFVLLLIVLAPLNGGESGCGWKIGQFEIDFWVNWVFEGGMSIFHEEDASFSLFSCKKIEKLGKGSKFKILPEDCQSTLISNHFSFHLKPPIPQNQFLKYPKCDI